MKNRKKLVYVAFSADLLHEGHINILKKASKYGKVLVGLLTDQAIISYRKIPHLNYKQREVILKNIKYVKKVVEQETLDYSKNPITDKTLSLLYQLADALHLKQHIYDLFSGKYVNTTQQLPALHTALRDPRSSGLIINGTDILSNIHAALDKMAVFVSKIQEQIRHF